MKKVSFTLLGILFTICISAQSISVSSFKILETDLTANTAGTMETDQNGETAALIKVVTTQTGFTFDGGVLGIVKTKQTPGEVWVYIPKGSKKISIKHPQLGVLREYYYPIAIEAARTYEMVLTTGTVQTIVNQARTSQYVVFQLEPSDAVVELDGELLQTTDGTATKMMKFGTYNYRVQAPSYLPEAGNITVNDPKNKHVFNVSLKPNFSVVTLKVDGDAEVWLNGEMKGNGSWTGTLGAGTYEIETKKTNHRTVSITKDITITHEPQTIILQAPPPILGEADINSKPAMANIYIDGKIVGQTPQAFSDLLIGEHQIRICKNGYKDYEASFIVKESEVSIISVDLKKSITEHDTSSQSSKIIKSSDENTITFEVGNTKFNMIRVEGGTFQMGANNEKGNDASEYEKPIHEVTLSSYYIGETEVTQALWRSIMGITLSSFISDNLPVECVSWDDCQDFLEKLSKMTGYNFRLPTEAEWEYAARGGNKSRNYIYSGSNKLNDVAWFKGNCKATTHEVRQKQANELGIFDMSGNVWEWVQDFWSDYSTSAQLDPQGPSSGNDRIFRGGSWDDDKWRCRVSFRNALPPDDRNAKIGFRLALKDIRK